MLIILLAVIVVASSCKKNLNEQLYSQIPATNFPKTAGDLRALCNGLYDLMDNNDFYGFTHFLLEDMESDQAIPTGYQPGFTGARYEIEGLYVTTGNSEILKWWQRSYVNIGRANNILSLAPGVPISDNLKAPYIAEAKFIRALMYFQLTKFFGDVPLITKYIPITDSILAFKPSRTSQQQVYQQIVNDLLDGELDLPSEDQIPATYKGLPSNGAASALLAKVYLTRAYLPFAETADFQNAALECQKVISNPNYALLPAFKDVFDVDKKNGKEHIFSIQFGASPNITSTKVAFLAPPQIYGARSFGSLQAERTFYNSFAADDTIRRNNTFFDKGVDLNGKKYNYVSTPTGLPFCGKWKDIITLTTSNDRTNYIVLRLADILLMQSEALNRINPFDPNKYAGIDSVRRRAGLQNLPFIDNVVDFETAISNERGWELAFEGQRRDDLIRLGRFVSTMIAAGKTNANDDYKYYPIPLIEIDLNPNLKPQNHGF
ncbi:RagB/SusD family nutrient uptake outer membrane protein [Parasediminibacterium sp. JCM 36343]|uniref:RagB/SusD family nutrient uptake outer membrane protein n=1 Tax=Parasediminibacterium sp. JCM 36343 TaxID=3374279 RepID=UPI003978D4BC